MRRDNGSPSYKFADCVVCVTAQSVVRLQKMRVGRRRITSASILFLTKCTCFQAFKFSSVKRPDTDSDTERMMSNWKQKRLLKALNIYRCGMS